VHTKIIVAAALLGRAALAQSVSLGVVAGTHLTDSFTSSTLPFSGGSYTSALLFSSGPKSLIIGPSIELRLPWRFSVEVDALHRNWESREQYVTSVSGLLPFTHSSTHTPWQFPILAKYRLPGFKLQPVLESGISLRPAGTGSGLSHVGFTAGAGVEVAAKGWRISPVLRYTRWSTGNMGLLRARPDQVEVFVGISPDSRSLRPYLLGRRLSFGVVAGAGLGQDFRPAVSTIAIQHPESNSPMVGANIEYAFTSRWSAEVDGIYRPLHATDVPLDRSGENRDVRFATLTWEFPVLAKYRFKMGTTRPFLEAGPSFRAIGNVEIAPPSHWGFTGGAGVEFAAWKFKFSPTFRYTRWSAGDAPLYPDSARAYRNESQLLVGFSF
jgi:hypothetical protein